MKTLTHVTGACFDLGCRSGTTDNFVTGSFSGNTVIKIRCVKAS